MKKLILTILLMLSATCFAQEKITCYSPRQSYEVTIGKVGVALARPFKDAGRAIASEIGARTRIVGSGFNKMLYLNGKKYTIHIEDKNSYSEADDYMTIRSSNGHEITYPLNCK